MVQTKTKIEITADYLLIDGDVSVESWEKPIQKKLAELTVKPTDVVAEFGYGLGMASETIQKIAPLDHWIIEPHYHVLLPIFEKELQHVNFILSTWQKVLPMIKDGYFDSIIYDADPNNIKTFDGSVEATLEFILPIFPHIRRILAPRGRLGFIDFSGILHKHLGFFAKLTEYNLDFEFVSIPIHPPSSCSYAQKRQGSIIKIIKN